MNDGNNKVFVYLDDFKMPDELHFDITNLSIEQACDLAKFLYINGPKFELRCTLLPLDKKGE